MKLFLNIKQAESLFIGSAFSLLFLIIPGIIHAEPGDTLTDRIFQPSIKTVLLHKNGWELSYPVINLGAGEKLMLSFDELTKTRTEYHYIVK